MYANYGRHNNNQTDYNQPPPNTKKHSLDTHDHEYNPQPYQSPASIAGTAGAGAGYAMYKTNANFNPAAATTASSNNNQQASQTPPKRAAFMPSFRSVFSAHSSATAPITGTAKHSPAHSKTPDGKRKHGSEHQHQQQQQHHTHGNRVPLPDLYIHPENPPPKTTALDAVSACVAWFIIFIATIAIPAVTLPVLMTLALLADIVSILFCVKRLRSPVSDSRAFQALEDCIAKEYDVPVSHITEDFTFEFKGTRYTATAHALYIPAPDHTLGSRTTRKTKTVLFIHSHTTTAISIAQIANEIVETGAEIYAIDLPGFGRSDTFPQIHSGNELDYPAFAAVFILKFMDVIQNESRVIAIGHGFGATIAAYAARMHQDRIGRLVLLSPIGIFPTFGDTGVFPAIYYRFGLRELPTYIGPVAYWAIMSIGWILNDDATAYYNLSILANTKNKWGRRMFAKQIALTFTSARWRQPAFQLLADITYHSTRTAIWVVVGCQDSWCTPDHAEILHAQLAVPSGFIEKANHQAMINIEHAKDITQIFLATTKVTGHEFALYNTKPPTDVLADPTYATYTSPYKTGLVNGRMVSEIAAKTAANGALAT